MRPHYQQNAILGDPMTDKPDGWRWWRSLPALTLVFSCIHLFALTALFLVLFSASGRRFNHGGSPGLWEPTAEATTKMLAFPLMYVRALVWMPVIVELAVCVLNSVLWGACAAWMLLRAFPNKKS
jgi:hypothetical protein